MKRNVRRARQSPAATSDAVTAAYRALVARDPDPGGLITQTAAVAADGLGAMVANLVGSREFSAMVGA